MTTFGVEFVIGIPAIDDLEERVDRLYASLAENFALVSIDVSVNLDKGSIAVLLGVEVPSEIEPDPLVFEIAEDAINKAIADSDTTTFSRGARIAPTARMVEFV